jgi:hypothetical protein
VLHVLEITSLGEYSPDYLVEPEQIREGVAEA